MNKTFKWIKDHVRPYITRKSKNNDPDDRTPTDMSDFDDLRDLTEETLGESEIGIKIKFKF